MACVLAGSVQINPSPKDKDKDKGDAARPTKVVDALCGDANPELLSALQVDLAARPELSKLVRVARQYCEANLAVGGEVRWPLLFALVLSLPVC